MARVLLAFLAAGVVLLVSGCGARLTDAQAAQLAQARANAEAAARCSDDAARATLFAAVHNRLLAGLASIDLPDPETPAAELVAADGTPVLPKVDAEAAKAKAAAADPPSGMFGAILGGIGGIALAALAALRFSPGAFGIVANLAHAYLAPRATRDMRAAQAKAGEVAEVAVAYGHTLAQVAEAHGLGPKVEELKERAAAMQDRLGIRPQVAAILAAVKAQRPPVAPPSPGARLPT